MTIAGYGIVFDGQDLAADRFTKSTDLWLDGRLSHNPPVLFGHGQDHLFGHTVLGHVVKATADDVGVWIEAKLQASKRYLDLVRKLMAKGVPLGWSSGSVPHLVQRTKSATPGVQEITVWPVVEWSIVDTPAEPRTLGVKELKSLAVAEPLLLPIAREAEKVQQEAKVAVSDLPDAAFAFIVPGTLDDALKTFPRANRHYPHHDESGDVDQDALKSALSAATSTDSHIEAIAHLWLHAHADELGHDHAHESVWAKGMAPIQLVAGLRLIENALETARQQSAMTLLKTDIKSGMRMQPEAISRVKAIVSEVGRNLNDAETIERGEDEKARVEFYRTQLALLEVGRA